MTPPLLTLSQATLCTSLQADLKGRYSARNNAGDPRHSISVFIWDEWMEDEETKLVIEGPLAGQVAGDISTLVHICALVESQESANS